MRRLLVLGCSVRERRGLTPLFLGVTRCVGDQGFSLLTIQVLKYCEPPP
jgi:hypothetical protein